MFGNGWQCESPCVLYLWVLCSEVPLTDLTRPESLRKLREGQLCASFLDKPQFVLCQASCDADDIMCFLNCLGNHSETSEWTKTALSCIGVSVRSSNEASSEELLQTCLQGSNGTMSTFQSALLDGLAYMASCSMGSCQGKWLSFVKDFATLTGCLDKCLQKYTSGSKESTLPQTIQCSISCVLFD